MATNVMPVKILVVKAHSFPEIVSYYNRDGQPLIPMTDAPDIIKTATIEMDDQLYCELMSIKTTSDAEQLTKGYPFLRFAYHSHPAFEIDELDTESRYYEAIVNAVSQFQDFRLFIEQRRIYLRLREKDRKDAASDITLRESFYETTSRIFRQINSACGISILKAYYGIGDNGEVSEAFMSQKSGMEQSYKELMDEPVEDRENLRIHHDTTVKQQAYEAFVACMFENITSYLTAITSRAAIAFDPLSSTVVYKCPDLLTALYLMAFVADFNADEYRQCAHPKCHVFFKVDSSHPQSMCDKHMAARRRKRENQKLKGATDYSKDVKPSDFEE